MNLPLNCHFSHLYGASWNARVLNKVTLLLNAFSLDDDDHHFAYLFRRVKEGRKERRNFN
jgi:hypothetical protein